jgi:hypothetical protein
MAAQITYVGGQSGVRAGSTSTANVSFSLTGGSDATPQAGDLVVITVCVGSQARNPACAVSGYTAYGQLNASAVTQDISQNVSYKFMGGTPDTQFTLPSTGNVADAQAYTVQVFRGVHSTPDDVASTTATGTGTGRPDPASITPTTAGAWVVICGSGGAAAGATYTGPANFTTNFLTQTSPDTNDAMVGSGYWSGWTSGAVNPAAYTGGTTGANDSWVARTIALRPAPDVTAPSLSAQTVDSVDSDGGVPKVTTNEADGTAYVVVVPNGDSPSVTQIKNGQNSSGGAALASSNTSVSATGVITFSAVSGLTSNTAYDAWFVHRDAAGNDSSAVKADFTTALAFADIRQDIINGLLSAMAETHGWNNDVQPAIAVTDVVRTSSTRVTITLPAVSTYDITALEAITVTVPSAALTSGGSDITATPTLDIDADADTTTQQTQSAIARITATATRTQTATARLTATTVRTQAALARITASATRTQTATARVTATTLRTQAAVAKITATTTRTQTATARVTITTARTQAALARLSVATAQTQAATARLTATSTKTQTATARVTATTTRTQAAIARLTATTTRTQAATARVTATTARTQSAVAQISNSPTKLQTAVARIHGTSSQTQPATARVQVTTPRTQTAIARIGLLTTRTQAATARLQQLVSRTQAALARIYGTTLRTTAATARLQKTTTQTVTAVARVQVTTTRTQAAVAALLTQSTRTQVATARIYGTTQRTQTSTARLLPFATPRAITGLRLRDDSHIGGDYGALVLADGATHFWRMHETSGSLVDAVAAKNFFSVTGTVTYHVAGGVSGGFALRLGAAHSRARLSGLALTLTAPYSIECWLTLGDQTVNGMLVGTTAAFGWFVQPDGTLLFTPATGVSGTSEEAIEPGTRSHLVLTVGAAVGGVSTVCFYINGELAGSFTTTGTTDLSISSALNDGGATVSPLVGQIAELATYAAVLTPAQVATHNAADRPPRQLEASGDASRTGTLADDSARSLGA